MTADDKGIYIWTNCPDLSLIKKVVGATFAKYKVPFYINTYGINEGPALEKFRPSSVNLCMGKNALLQLQEANVLKKNRSIKSMRNVVHCFGDHCSVILTYNPMIIQRDHARVHDIHWDAELACRFFTTKTASPVVGLYSEVPDFSKAIEFIHCEFNKTKKPVLVSMDLETMGLDYLNPNKHIISISVTVREGEASVLLLKDGACDAHLLAQLKFLLTSKEISLRGAGFTYDLHWLRWKLNLRCSNYKFDTLIVGSLLDENRSNSLNNHAKIYTTMGGYDDAFNSAYNKSFMEKVPAADLIQYAGGDTDACLRVSKRQAELLMENEKLCHFYIKLLHPALRVFERLEDVGVVIDLSRFYQLQQDLGNEMAVLKDKIYTRVGTQLRYKHLDSDNPIRPALVTDYLFSRYGLNLDPMMTTAKTGAAATSMEHLNMFSANSKAKDFIALVKEYKLAEKTRGTYVDGFLAHAKPDGRFHASYVFSKGEFVGGSKGEEGGTVTGRLSVKGPALQTIPKHTKWAKRIRGCYTAPDGYEILNMDFSEMELRLIADRSGDALMISAYNKGLSLHAITASELSEMPLEEYMAMKVSDPEEYDHIRRNAKAVNFGFVYGMWPAGFQHYAKTIFNLTLSLQEATRYRDKFFKTYPSLGTWHKSEIAFARKNGYVVSPLGRVRHLPLIKSPDEASRRYAERQAINSPIQGSGSDLLLLSSIEVDRLYRGKIFPFLMIHDSLCLYIPLGEREVWVPKVRAIMENLPLKKHFGWDIQVPIKADAEVGPDLAALKPIGDS